MMTTKTAMFREAPLPLWGRRCRTGRKWRRERRQTTPNAQQEAEAEAPGGVATRWGLRCWAMQQPTEQEGHAKRWRRDEWRRPRRRVEAQREGGAEALRNVTTNQTRGACRKAEV